MGVIGLIVPCTASPKIGRHIVFPGLVVSCEISVCTVSLRLAHFTSEKEKRWLEQKVWNQLEVFLPCMLPFKGHCLKNYFVLLSVGIVARSDFRVIFLWLVLFLLNQKVKVKTSPLSGIWLPSMSHFFFMMHQSLLSGCFCCNPFHLVWGMSAIKHCPVITVYIFTFLA